MKENSSTAPTAPEPITGKDRIIALDVLRGFALLGILILNIQAFAMPPAAYSNPAAFGSLEGVNGAVWTLSHVFADQKFMSIFSLLFGAGICLFADRAQEKSGRSAGLFCRRTLVLLLMGIAHGYLLFYGDILYSYALCALGVFLLRNRSPRTLMIIAGMLLCVPTLLSLLFGWSVEKMPVDEKTALIADWEPSKDQTKALVNGMRGSFPEQLAARAPTTVMLETVVFLVFFLWRVSGMMLLGMALYKTGVFTAQRNGAWYRRLAMISLPLGLGLTILGVVLNFNAQWAFEYSMFYGAIPNYWGSIAVSIGYIALVMLAVKNQILPALQARLAAVGRMALTNYLAHSLICTFIFNTLGHFGAMPRWQQVVLVALIWILQLWWSPLWLARFRMGPLEWLWRAATYGRFSALKVGANST